MARRTITIDEKIEKAEATFTEAKKKYDAALDNLKKIVTKKKQLDAAFELCTSPTEMFEG